MRSRIKKLATKTSIYANRKAWKFYLNYFRYKSHLLLLSFLLTIAQAALFLPVAVILRRILNNYIKEGDTRQILLSGLMVSGIIVGVAGVRLLNKRLILNHNKLIHNRIRDDLFARIYNIPKMYYSRLENMRWHTIFTHDVLRLDSISVLIFTNFLPAVVICAALSMVLLYINWILFLIVLTIAPFIMLAMIITTRKLRRIVFTRRKAIHKYNRRINFALQMMDLTRIQVAEDEEIAKQESHNAFLRSLDIRSAWLNEIFKTIQDTLIMLMTVVLLVGGGMAAVGETISLGDLFTFYVVFMFMRKYLFQMFNFFPQLINGNEALERVYEIVAVDDDRPYSGSVVPESGFGIEVSNVQFSYGQEPLLEDVNFKIEEGEFIALQGANGSGKTTLLFMILGFYRPDDGMLSFGGISYDELDIKSMRQEFGVVLQESPIFRGTIKQNILYGRHDVDDSAFEDACRISGVDQFVLPLPESYDTEVGDRGGLLSGGQRQRIAIARALVTRPRILVLDEPTNHLDQQAIRSLLRHLHQFDYKPTVIMISHTPEFVSHADRILRVENGTVIEFDADAELDSPLDSPVEIERRST